jgi:tRNA threonylcarbamoyl adenosine modification protein (Sua5/YciO/YrdC/YwlC family)
LTLPVLAPSAGVAFELGRVTGAARRLAARFWPGPLTLVLARSARSVPWELGGQVDTIGLRVPDHPLALALLARTGPLAATSANRSGRPPLDDADELVRTFGPHATVILVMPGGASPGEPSTVVGAAGARLSLLREGAIGRSELREALTDPDRQSVDFD